MKPRLREAFEAELGRAKVFYRQGDIERCFHHLERAHILGQRHYLPHLRSHYWMLKAGWRAGDGREVRGQLLRLAASAGSLFGTVPIGNTGRARVHILKPMPIPEDLARYF